MNMIQAVVTNGKIEIQAPSDFHEGDTVFVIVLNHSASDEPLSTEQIASSLRALDQFTASFSILADGEDLSAPARLAGDAEKQHLSSYSDQLKGRRACVALHLPIRFAHLWTSLCHATSRHKRLQRVTRHWAMLDLGCGGNAAPASEILLACPADRQAFS